jgi:filamentous hemagglutinin family protein
MRVAQHRATTAQSRWAVLLRAAVAAAGFGALARPLRANPTNGTVTAGSAAISSPGAGVVVVTQASDRAIIDWQNFSIGTGELTKFVQPSATAAVLNRVTGSNPSALLGGLQANGRVYLINPNGVVVGQGATIQAGAFAASTLDVPDAQFLAGKDLDFAGGGSASIVNLGTIDASQGSIFLLAQQVTNAGVLRAPAGTVGLAAGTEITLTQNGSEQVQVTAPLASTAGGGAAAVLNSGTIRAAQAELAAADGNLYALAINNTGVIRAMGTRRVGGHIFLTASDGSGSISSSGTLAAAGPEGSGGSVAVAGGMSGGTVTIGGAVDASAAGPNGSGGRVTITASNVDLTSEAAITANGGANGGTILIGGDRHGGSDPSQDLSPTPLPNAQTTTVAEGARISADGGSSGDGGSVVLWSDVATDFGGSISARGGAQGGNGGFAEVSSHGLLEYTGWVDLAAPLGKLGSLLLDPADVTIDSSATNNDSFAGGTYTPTAGAGSSTILNTDLELELGAANVQIVTTSSGGSAGTITVDAPVTWATGNSLTLTASGSIAVNANIENTSAAAGGSITLTAGAGSGIALASDVTVSTASSGAAITLQGDSLTMGSGASVMATGASNSQVIIQPATTTDGIDIGGTTAGDLQLSAASLNDITAGTLVIGNTADTTNALLVDTNLDTISGDPLQHVTNLTLQGGSGGITINNLITLASTGVLTLNTTGTATQGASAALTVSGAGSGLQLLGAAGTYTLTGATNAITTLAASVGTGTVKLANGATALSIGAVGATNGVTATEFDLTDTGGVTQTKPVTGKLSLSGSGTFNLTGATNAVSTLAASIGTGTLQLSNGATALSIGTVNAINGVTAAELDLTDTGTVTQTQAISANLDMLGAAGTYTLTGATNAIPVLAGSIGTGTAKLADGATALSIGTVNGTAGVTAGELDITDTGGVSETAAVTGKLSLSGSGTFNLTGATNAVSTLAASIGTGTLKLTDGATALSIGTVNAINGVTAAELDLTDTGTVIETQAITANLDMLGAAGTYTLTGATNAVPVLAGSIGTGTAKLADGATALSIGTVNGTAGVTAAELDLTDTGGVTETSGVTGKLSLSGSGTFNLTGATNAVSTLAGSIGTGTLQLTNGATALSIGTVNAINGVTAAELDLTDTATVTQTQPISANLDMLGAAGTYTLTGATNAVPVLAGSIGTGTAKLANGATALSIGTVNGTAGVTAGELDLTDTGGVSETSAVTGKLSLSGSGTFNLTGATNAVSTLAASIGTGTLKLANGATALSIGTVNAINGVTAAELDLTDTGTVTQTQAITANLDLLGSGATYTLTGATNAIPVIAGSIGAGTVKLTNGATALSIGTVNGTAGITAAELDLTDTGTVTQTQAISLTNLDLLGAGGTYSLTNASNSVSTLAGSTGTVSLTDASALTLNTVNGTNNLTATGAVTLTDNAIALTATTGLISASGQTVTLQPATATDGIDIGGTTAGDLQLSAASLNDITAGTLVIGNTADTTNALLVDTNLDTISGDPLQHVTNLTLQGGSGGITINNLITLASTGVLTLNTTGTATQGASAALTVSGAGSGLQLLGAAGTYTLTGATNAITTLAASVGTGTVKLANGATALSIGAVGATNGVTATEFDLTDTGGVTQTKPVTGKLSLSGSGTFNLTGATNAVSTLAASIGTGTLQLTNGATALSIGTVNAINGVTATELDLTDTGTVTQTQAISANLDMLGAAGTYTLTGATNAVPVLAGSIGTGTAKLADGATALSIGTVNGTAGVTAGELDITDTGGVSETAAVTGKLSLSGSGTFNLTGATNAVSTLAASIGTGTLQLTNGATALSIGTVNAINGVTAAELDLTDTGTVTETQAITANLDMLGAAGTYTLTGATNAVPVLAGSIGTGTAKLADGATALSIGTVNGTAGVTAGELDITDTGGVTETSGVTGKLSLSGSGTFNLTGATNAVSTLAASIGTGTLKLANGATALSIGTVNAINGVTAAELDLTDTGTVTETQAITANLDLLGSGGTFNLTGATNAVSTLAASIGTGTLKLANGAAALSIGTINGTTGVTAAELDLTDTGTVTQTQAITANLDILGAAGTYTLTGATNAVPVLAGSIGTGTAKLADGSTALSIGTVNGTAGVTAGELDLTDTGGVSETSGVTGKLSLSGSGTFNLTGATNAVSTLAASIGTGTLQLTNGATALSIGTVNAINGVTAAEFDLTDTGTVTQTQALSLTNLDLLGAGGTYTLTNAANSVSTLAGSTGTVSLTDASALTLNTVNGTNSLTVTGAVTLTDNAIALTAATGLISASGQTVTLQPATATDGIDIGGTTAGDLQLSAASLNDITAGTLVIGNTADTTNALLVDTNLDTISGDPLQHVTNLTLQGGSGGITINNLITLASTGVLTLNTTGTATQGASAALTVSGAGSGLQLLGAAGTYTLTGATNAITTLAASVGTGTVKLANGATALSIGAVGATNGVTATEFDLTDTGGVTQTKPVTGKLSLSGSGTFNLTGATNAVSTLAASIGTGTLQLSNGATALSIGTVNAINGVTAAELDLTDTGTVTQTQAISANLDMLGAAGTYTLTGATNAIPVLAGSIGTGTAKLADGATALSIGTVNGTAGVTAGELDITDTGGVSETAAVTGKLSLSGSGTFNLTGATNAVSTLAASIGTGTLQLTNGATALSIGTVNAINGVTAAELDLTDTGTVTETQAITANLDLLGSGGTYTLTGATNAVPVLAGSIGTGTAKLANGATALSIGSVNGTAGVTAAELDLTDTGTVTETQAITANLDMLGAAGTYTLTGATNAIPVLAGSIGTGTAKMTDGSTVLSIGTVNGTAGVTAGELDLTDTGGVSETSGVTGKLSLSGSGTFNLTGATNAVSTLAASIGTGTLKLADGATTLSIGTVNAITGVTAAELDLTDTGTVTQTQAITANLDMLGAAGTYTLTGATNAIPVLAGSIGTGTAKLANGSTALSIGTVNGTAGVTAGELDLTDTGGVSETAAVTGKLSLSGSGTFNLTGATNAVSTLAATIGTGTLQLTNGATALSIGTVNAINGVTAAEFDLTDTGTVTQTQALSLTNLDLLGAGGTYTLTNAANSVSTLAGSTGTVSLTDASALTLNTVNGTNNLTATGAVTLTDNAIALTATTGLISASGQTVTLQPATATDGIDIGGTTAGDLQLSAASLNDITAGTLVIGNTADTTNALLVDTNLDTISGDPLQHVTNLTLQGGSGGITINNLITLASTGVLTLNTTGTATQGASAALTVSGAGSGLQLLGAAGTYTLTGATNAITTLAASVGTGTVKLANGATALSIGAVGATNGVTATEFDLTDTGGVTQTKPVTGKLSLSGSGTFNLTGATNAVSTLAASIGTGTLQLSNGATALSIGTVNAINGVTAAELDLTDTGTVTETQAITANLDMLGAAGTYTLTGATNAVPVLAGSIGTGTAKLADGATALSIGTVNGTAGVTAGELDITDTGGVSETSGVTGKLSLSGSGTFNLTGATNAVSTLAASIGTGTLKLTNGATALSIGTVNAINGVTAAELDLTETGTVTQTQALSLTNLDLLGAGGTYTLTNAANSISALAGSTGTISLTDASALTLNTVNGTNNLTATGAVTLIDNSIALTAATGLISAGGQTVTLQPLTANTAITVGGTNSGFDLTAAELNDVTATTLVIGSDGTVGNASGAISVTAAIAPGSVTNLGLLSGSTVGQTAGSTITVSGLKVSGTAESLAEANAVGTVAIKASGNVSFTSTQALTIGTVAGLYGVASTGGTVTVETGGNLTLAAGAGAAVSGAGSGTAIQLVDGGTFTNDQGSGALSVTGGGRWLVWSGNPANDNRGSLAYGFKQYDAVFGTTTPANGTDDGFLYTLAPLITPGLTGTVTKQYDGTTVATLVPGNYTSTSGAVDGDTVTLSDPTSGTYDTPDVGGPAKTVTVTGISIVSAANGSAAVYGYGLASTTASGSIGSITQEELIYTANPVSQTYGTAIPTFTGTVTGLENGDTLSSVTTGTAVFTSTATQSSNVGGYAITGSGLTLTDPNYSLVQAASNTTALTITPATLTFTAAPVGQTYGTAIPTLNGTVTGFVLGQNQATATTGTLAFTTSATQSSNVGTYAINGSGLTANNGNYTFVQAGANSSALSITPATLTYTANPVSQSYGTAIPTLTGTVTGFVLGQTQATATTGTLAFTTSATQTSNVGTYAINGSGLTANNGNYTFVQAAANGTALSITPATLTYTANPVSQTYGTAIPTFTGTVTGFVLGQSQATATTGTLAFTTSATQSSNVGTYAIDGSGLTADNGDYTFVQATANNTALSITPATLTYTANPVSQTYGTAIPTFTGTVTGFVLGQSQATATTGTLAFTTSATQSSDVGTYAIDGSGLTANNGNYTFVQAAANNTALSITPATLTYTANPVSQTYGTAIPTFTGTVSGFVLGQSQATATTGTLAFTTPATQSSNVGTYAINGSGLTANNGDYTFVQAAANSSALSITPATLTYTASPVSQTYGTAIPTLTGTVSGFVLGQSQATATTGTLAFTTTATQPSNVGTYAIDGSGLTANNGDYTFVQAAANSSALSITPATLTYTANPVSQTYGTAIPTFTGTVTGFVLGQSQATATSGTLAFTTPATQSSNVGAYAIDGSGLTANNGNYTFVQAAANGTALSITPATLTYTANPVSQTYGTAIPTLTGTVSGFVLGQTQATATTGTLAFSTSATQSSNVGTYTIDGSGLTANNGNYTLVQAAANSSALSITPATLTYTANPVSQTYGTAIPTFTGTITGFVLGQSQATATTGTLAFTTPANQSSNVGTYAIDGSGLTANNGNYTFVQAAANSSALSITPATLTYTANPVSQTYGTAIPTFTGTVTGFVLGQTQATATTGTLAFTTSATQSSNVGSYGITGSGLTADNGNYTFIEAAANSTALSLAPAILTYTANPISQSYGTAIPTFTGTVTGFVLGQTKATATTGTLAFTTSATQSSNVGSYGITGSGLAADNGNYTFVQAAANSSALSITPATLTYTANPVSQTYGTAIPTLTGTVTGFVLGQTQATETTGSVSFTTAATQSSNVGTYGITGSGLTPTNGNYSLVQAPGNSSALSIAPATLTYTANPVTQIYGTAIPTFTGTVTGFVLGQTQATATTGSLAFTSPATQSSNVGTYAISGSGLTANNGDYTLVQAAANSSALSITPATLTYTANPVSQTYGTAIPTLTGTVTGFVLGQTQATATTGTLAFTTSATQSSNVGTYGITGSGLTADNGNYTFVQAAANNSGFSITPATLTYTANPVTQIYGTAIPALTGTVTGFVLGQTQAAETTGSVSFTTAATQSSNVGTYGITGSGLTPINGNYQLIEASANSSALSITPATLTYNANPVSQTYGTAIPTLTGTVTGFVLGQTQATATTGTLAFSTSATQSSNVGTYAIDGSGLTANNGDYTFVQAAANSSGLSISPATLTFTANPVSQTYGTAIPTLTGTVTGFVLGQTQETATTGTLAFTSSAIQSSNVGSYAVTGSGLTANNGDYTFVQAAANSAALSITPATLTYTANPVGQTYGTAIPTFTGTVTGFVLGQTQETATTGTLAFATVATPASNIQTYAITGSGLTANNGNYTFVQAPGNASALTIAPAILTYTASPVTETYGTPVPVMTGTVTGFVLGQTQATATSGTVAFTTSATQTSDVGSYAVNGSGLTLTNPNYTLVQAPANASALTINPATLTYTAGRATQTYGTAIPTLTGTVTGFVLGQTQATATTGIPAFTTSATQSSNVGSYGVTGSGLSADKGDYVFVQAAGNASALSITPATLTYAAAPVTQTYGTAIPTLTGTVTGFVLGQTQATATTGTPVFATGATQSSDVGSYAITGSGLAAIHGNYTFVQATGNTSALTINPATLTYVAAPITQTYRTPIPAVGGTVTGFVLGQTLSSATTGTPVFATEATDTSLPGRYAIDGSGLSASNYVFVQAAGNASALALIPFSAADLSRIDEATGSLPNTNPFAGSPGALALYAGSLPTGLESPAAAAGPTPAGQAAATPDEIETTTVAGRFGVTYQADFVEGQEADSVPADGIGTAPDFTTFEEDVPPAAQPKTKASST